MIAQQTTLDDVRAAMTTALPPRGEARDGLVPYDDNSRKVRELTLREALRLGHNYIGTEHIRLALLDGQPDGGLASLGLGKADIEESIAAHLQKLT